MKKSILAIVFALLISEIYSQGNLQFNQVKLVSTIETVPTGKVWKVENANNNGGSFIILNGSTNPYTYARGSYILNGSSICYYDIFMATSSNNGLSGITSSSFPLWLPAGSSLAAGTNTINLSVIEFNIVP